MDAAEQHCAFFANEHGMITEQSIADGHTRLGIDLAPGKTTVIMKLIDKHCSEPTDDRRQTPDRLYLFDITLLALFLIKTGTRAMTYRRALDGLRNTNGHGGISGGSLNEVAGVG